MAISQPAMFGLEMGLQALMGGGNMFNQGQMNKKNRRFAERQNTLQWERTVDMWNRTNEYNSPVAQMQRFKDAGLNPHLIYGKGTPGNATMGQPQQAKWQGQPLQMPDIRALQTLSGITDIKQKNAQTDNLFQLLKNYKQDEINKRIGNYLKLVHAKYAPYLESMNAQAKTYGVLKQSQEIEKLIRETRKLNQTADYEKWKYKFIQEHGYTPDAPPSQWKFLYDTAKYIRKNKNKWRTPPEFKEYYNRTFKHFKNKLGI
jgi:hypothetical protein